MKRADARMLSPTESALLGRGHVLELQTKAGRPKDRLTVPILVATLEERERERA